MKQININVLYATLFLTGIIGILSCTNKKTEDTKNIAEEHNEAKFERLEIKNDAQFLVNAAEINLEEIQLGKLAQIKGITADIKELGKIIEVAHSKSQNELIQLAAKKQITIPTTPTISAFETFKKLNKKRKNEFDKEYCDKMVSGHKNAITLFEKATTESTDPDIRNWATTTLSILRTHLDNALTCQTKMDKMQI